MMTIERIALFASAVMLTVALYWQASTINGMYYDRWPVQGDTASYWIRDLDIAEQARAVGYRAAILAEALANNRDPARTLAFLLVPENFAYSVNGHLFYSCFSLLLFLGFFGGCVLHRSGSLLLAIGAQIAALLPLGILNPLYGFPSRLPDLPASFVLGAALAVSIHYRNSTRPTLPALLVGALLGLATLTRFHVWVYGLFLLLPIFGTRAAQVYASGERRITALALPTTLFLAGWLLVSGWFIFTWAVEVFTFYSIAGYALNKTMLAAISSTGLKLIVQHLGFTIIAVGALIFGGIIATTYPRRGRFDPADLMTIVWGAVALPILLLLIMRVEDDVSQTYYMVPGLLLALLCPYAVERQSGSGRLPLQRFSSITLLACTLLFISNFITLIHSESFRYPRPRMAEIAVLNEALTESVVQALSPARASKLIPTLDSNFDYYVRFIIPRLRQRHGLHARFANIFQIRESQWRLLFPGTTDNLLEQVTEQIDQGVHVFFAIAAFPTDVMEFTVKDDFTKQLAEGVARHLHDHPDLWRPLGSFKAPFGEVIAYQNLNLLPD